MVEDINKKREPLAHLEAIYMLAPIEKSIHGLISDFGQPSPLYKTAHVYLTEGTFKCVSLLFSCF